MKDFLTIKGQYECEQVIEKSRFITYSTHVESEDEAKNFISQIKKMHPFATHNCYAYIADIEGNVARFSDDGEPQGTAGLPMLSVLKSKNLRQICTVVTRYFGGIKLGAGGLVRAYSSSVSQNLEGAEVCKYMTCSEVHACVGYDMIAPMQNFLEKNRTIILDTLYSDLVTFKLIVVSEELNEYKIKLNNYLNGKVEIIEKESYFYPFKV